MIDIALKSEYIFSVFGFLVTNTYFTSFLVTIFLIIGALYFYFWGKNHQGLIIKSIRVLIFEVLKITDTVTQDRRLSKKILPLIATFFIFIVANNLLALIPGFLGSFYIKTATANIPVLRSPNSDLTTTLALALVSVFAIQYFSWQALGFIGYLKRFINLSNPVDFILGFFEIISETVKILSFSFRLFGNIFAGEVLLVIIAFLVPYIIPLPFMILEIFVGIIQAFIFAMLTLTFIKTSTIKQLEVSRKK